MKNIKLYIGGMEVELTKSPSVLFTYQIDDINNPTAVKNSFTKTVTIEGTDINDRIFGSFWRLDRSQGSRGTGSSFNSTKKVDFQLFVGSDITETGYVQLNDVKNNGSRNQYELTLYGGLGDFFYNLDVDDNTGDKRKLSSLSFKDDIDFTINRTTVHDAWESLRNNREDKYQTINFIPSYNGLPKDFDSKHVLINTEGTTFEKNITEDGIRYSTRSGYILGNLADNYDEHQMRDYRSYLMRPAIRMRKIVEACCDPDNNGGYEVQLDDTFFNDSNPYYNDTWLTLPTLSNLELNTSEDINVPSSLVPDTATQDDAGYIYQDLVLGAGSFPKMDSLTVSALIKTNNAYNYSSTYTKNFWGNKKFYYGSLFVQLVAYNGDVVVGYSDVYNLTSDITIDNSRYVGTNAQYTGKYKCVPIGNATISDTIGIFDRDGFRLNNSVIPYTFFFTINKLTSSITNLKLRYFWGANDNKINDAGSANWLYLNRNGSGTTRQGCSPQNLTPEIKTKSFSAILNDTLARSNVKISKDMILNTDNSPCDYLLSYCKHFGLYFTKEIDEKIVKIETRETYYDRESLIDISDYIDKASDITIKPTVFDQRWIQMKPELEESDFSNKYMLSNGVQYGEKLINTGYEFNSDKKNIFNNNCIKDAVEGHQRSSLYSYFKSVDGARSIDKSVRTWMYGMTYNLYNGDSTIERTPEVIAGQILGINDEYKFYDFTPKVQFQHDNSPNDGNDVLVFFSGFKDIPEDIYYWLTDDVAYQSLLNNGEPCWLFTTQATDTNGSNIAIRMDYMPVFERYMTTDGSPYIQESLDMGVTRELYCQGYKYRTGTTIYEQFWGDYLEDLYDVDTKILKCKMLIPRGLNSYNINNMLRKFYWYDNVIWRINKITDYDVTSNGLTNVEFIKVKDRKNYTSNKKTEGVKQISIKLHRYTIDQNGGMLPGNIFCSGPWTLSYDSGMTITPSTGSGNAAIIVRIDPSTTPRRFDIILTQTDTLLGAVAVVNQTIDATLDTFTVSPRSLDFNANGGNLNVNVQDDGNHGFIVRNENTWLKTTVNGNTITVSCDENNNEEERTGTIIVVDMITNNEYNILVNQRALVISKHINAPSSFEVNSMGGTYFYEVDASHEWEITNPFGTIGVYTRNGNMVVINSSANDTDKERTDGVIVRLKDYPEYTATTVVKQAVYEPLEPEPILPEFTISNPDKFESDGGRQILCASYSDFYSFTVKASCNWIQTTDIGDGCFRVEASANDSTEERFCQICFTGHSGDKTMERCTTVIQKGKEEEPIEPEPVLPEFTISTPDKFEADGGNQILCVYDNDYYDRFTVNASCDWIQTTAVGRTCFRIDASANDTTEDRFCNVCFTGYKGDKTLQKCTTIIQKGKEAKRDFTINPDSIDRDYNAGYISIEVITDSDWDYFYALTECDFIRNTSVFDERVFNFQITKNTEPFERECIIHIVGVKDNFQLYKQAHVKQSGNTEEPDIEKPDFELYPNPVNVDGNGGQITLTVLTNSVWDNFITSQPCDWITYDSSVGNRVFTFNVEENTSIVGRRCTITFVGNKGDLQVSKTVEVLQAGKTYIPTELPNFDLSTDNMEFEQKGGSQQFCITINNLDKNVNFNITTECSDWISFKTADLCTTITVKENPSALDRTCEVVVTGSNDAGMSEKRITIKQDRSRLIPVPAVPDFEINDLKSEFDANGGTDMSCLDIELEDGLTLKIEPEHDWVQVTELLKCFIISVEANDSYRPRVCDIVFTLSNGLQSKTKQYTIQQNGKYAEP